MKYYSEEDLRKIIPLHYLRQILAYAKPINVRFCRDCHNFEKEHYSSTKRGWCRDLSWWEDENDQRLIYVLDDHFCNEDDINEY